jgi:hypothetical protein
MTRRDPNRPPRLKASSATPSRFAPKAFLAGSPQDVQRLCEALAAEAALRLADLTGTTWTAVATSIVADVRATGHDLIALDHTDELRQWQATWYHPRGTFSLLLSFRAPRHVEVTWQTDDATFSASA